MGIVNTDDVVVTDTNGDGTGHAVLTFPGGESITLESVLASEVSSPAQLNAMGIPLPDYTVSGTSDDDTIDAAYLGDPEGAVVDGNDNAAGGQQRCDRRGAGNDSVASGAGDDTVYGGAGNDTIDAWDGDDTVFGGGRR